MSTLSDRNREIRRVQDELKQRARRASIYRPHHGKKFMTKGRPGRPMIVDPITGQWWRQENYLARENRVAERLKALRE